jgi:hypothetical protein
MATPKKFTVFNAPIQGRIKGTADYGITEAIGNIFQPGVKNPGVVQAFKNWLNPAGYQGYDQLPAVLPEFRGLQDTARPTVTALTDTTPAGKREYEAEKSRIAQLTEQDPLFKKYQVAELSKQYNAAKGDEREKIGMQIWAQTNPQLAAKLRPGATGYSDVATAFQKLSPVGNIAGGMAPGNFTMSAVNASTMPTVEQAFGANAPQVNIPGIDTSAVTTAVAPGAFSQSLSTDITNYLTDPLKAYAPTEKIDQTQLALLKQAYNQKIK